MTLKHLVEQVQQQFSDIGFTQCKLFINQAYKDFARQTRIIKSSISITDFSESAWSEIDAVWEDVGSAWAYDLNATVDRVVEIYFLDSDGKAVEDDTIKWDIVNNDLVLYFTSGSDYALESLPFEKIVVNYIAIPSDLELETDTTSIKEQYGDAILSRALEKAAALKRDWHAVQYYANEYKTWLVDAKKSANTGLDNTEIFINDNYLN